MKRAISFALALLVAGLLCVVQQQPTARAGCLSLLGVGGPCGASPTYVGPGDVVSSASAWFGLRAYNAAYATGLGKIANICNPSDAACADVFSNASGNLNLGTIGGVTCANSVTVCTIKTLYDQSGTLQCSGAACNATQATIANRPTLQLNCFGGTKFCGSCGATTRMDSATATTINQPYTYVAFGLRPGSATGPILTNTDGTTFTRVIYFSAANTAAIFSTTSATATATDNVSHALLGMFNTSSSKMVVDGASTAGLVGAGNSTGFWTICTDTGTHLTGFFAEAGAYSGDQSASATSLSTNQHAYWDF
jgi:hypothetical protein